MLLLLTLAVVSDGPVMKVGSRSAPAPISWTAEKPSNRLRSHQFKLPAAEEGGKPGELVVLPDSDPNPDKMFPRWAVTVMPDDDGIPPEENARRSKAEKNGLTLYRLDAIGTWKYRDFPQAKKEEQRPGWRVVWVIVVEGTDATHLRLSGPTKVIEKQLPVFDKWLDAVTSSPKR